MQIVGMVHQRFKLSGELQEVNHTDIKSTFPLSVVKEAQEIPPQSRRNLYRRDGKDRRGLAPATEWVLP
jgi:hypothetical protein